jgi:D-alanine-D-alanine ligase
MRIGIAYDLKKDFVHGGGPEDLFEEYDSEETIDAIAAALRAAGHEPVKMGGGQRFIERALFEKDRIDLVFNIAEGRGSRSREAHVPAVCEMLRIPFTHSDPLTLAVSLDKAITKRIVASHGVPTAPFALIERPEDIETAILPPFPAIAKLDCEGSSMGIRKHSRAATRAELEAQVRHLLATYGEPVLVEKFLSGVEVTAGVLGTGAAARVLGIMEIAPRKAPCESFIYSLEVKRNFFEEVEYHVPARLPPATLAAIEGAALGAYRAIGCRDVGRVDLRLDEDGTPCFIEVNPLPGLNPATGDLPILARRAGLSYEALIAAIVESALSRQAAPLAA